MEEAREERSKGQGTFLSVAGYTGGENRREGSGRLYILRVGNSCNQARVGVESMDRSRIESSRGGPFIAQWSLNIRPTHSPTNIILHCYIYILVLKLS